MENRDDIQVEGNALAGVTREVLEKYGENSNLKEDGVGWLRRSSADILEKMTNS